MQASRRRLALPARTSPSVTLAISEGAERVAGEIKAAGGRAITVQGDLAKTADIEAMVAKAVATFGPIDTLVNNAAVFDFKALSDIDEAHFHHIFNTNVLGLLTTTKVAVANFNSAGGSVINISSLSALGNAPNSAVYSSSKAAVNAITKVLALELAERKIRVNAIMPGYFDTEGARAVGVKGSEEEAQLIAATPLEKRPGHPSDLSPGRDLLGLPRVGVDDGGNPHGFRGKTLNGSQHRFFQQDGA